MNAGLVHYIREHQLYPLPLEIPVIDATPVSDELNRFDEPAWKGMFQKEAYPNIAPPFPQCFLEWGSVLVHGDNRALGRFGVVVTDATEGAGKALKGQLATEDYRWLLSFHFMLDISRRFLLLPGAAYVYVGGEGEINGDKITIQLHKDYSWISQRPPNTDIYDWLGQVINIANVLPWDFCNASMMPIALRTLSIMNCKNVTLEDSPLRRQQRRQLERKGVPTDIIKILKIKPYGTRTKGGGVETSEPRRLERSHVVRGHFKEFTEDAPLFGKWSGLFFWGSHLRGDAAQGKVEKSYKVYPDEG